MSLRHSHRLESPDVEPAIDPRIERRPPDKPSPPVLRTSNYPRKPKLADNRPALIRRLRTWGGRYSSGNDLTVVAGDTFFSFLEADIRSSSGFVLATFFSYGASPRNLWPSSRRNDKIAARTVAAMTEARERGCQIGVAVDGIGSFLPSVGPLCEIGVDVRRFHPPIPSGLLAWAPTGRGWSQRSSEIFDHGGFLAPETRRAIAPQVDAALAAARSRSPDWAYATARRINRLQVGVRTHAKGVVLAPDADTPVERLVAWDGGFNHRTPWITNERIRSSRPPAARNPDHEVERALRYTYDWLGRTSRVNPRFDVALRIRGPGARNKGLGILRIWEKSVRMPHDRWRGATALRPDQTRWEMLRQGAAHLTEPLPGTDVYTGGVIALESMGALGGNGPSANTMTNVEMIAAAHSRVVIVTPYLEVPRVELEAIAAKKRENPDFEMIYITNGDGNDMAQARRAGRAQYETLLLLGAKVLEYAGEEMFHWKCTVADPGPNREVVARIGSSNDNERSSGTDVESDTVALDEAAASRLAAITTQLSSASREITLDNLPYLLAHERSMSGITGRAIDRFAAPFT